MDPIEQFILSLVKLTIAEADRQGIDRDEFIEFVAYMFEALSVTSTFKKFQIFP